MQIRVECQAGHRGAQEPRRFWLGARALEVQEIVDRWLHPEQRYFKVRADDGRQYVLRHDEREDFWDLAALVGEHRQPRLH